MQKHNADEPGLIKFARSEQRKVSSIIIENAVELEGKKGYNKRLLIQGDPHTIKDCCETYLGPNGLIKPMSDANKNQIGIIIDNYTNSHQTPVALAYKDLEAGQNGANHDEEEEGEPNGLKTAEKSGLTLVCILAIGQLFLSDATKVAGREWRDIKSEAMEDNYSELDWVQALSEHETKVLE